MPRFSIRQLLIATALAAAGVVALMNATGFIGAMSFGIVAVLLTVAVLLAIFRDGERRAYWIGFAVCGWLYVFLCFGIFAVEESPLGWTMSVTGRLSLAAYDGIYRGTPQSDSSGSTPPTRLPIDPYDPFGPPIAQPAVNGPHREDFLMVSHALLTLLFATCGGYFAAWLYATRPKPAS